MRRAGLRVDTAASPSADQAQWIRPQLRSSNQSPSRNNKPSQHSDKLRSASRTNRHVDLENLASTYPAAKLKSDDLFYTWLSEPNNLHFINSLIKDMHAGTLDVRQTTSTVTPTGSNSNTHSHLVPSRGALFPSSPTRHSALSPAQSPPVSPRHRGTPRSPTSGSPGSHQFWMHAKHISPSSSPRTSPRAINVGGLPHSPHSAAATDSHSASSSSSNSSSSSTTPSSNNNASATTCQSRSSKVIVNSAADTQREMIESFYVSGQGGRGRGVPIPGDALEYRREEIKAAFLAYGDIVSGGIELSGFADVCKDLCDLPVFFNALLFRRIRWLAKRWQAEKNQEEEEEIIAGARRRMMINKIGTMPHALSFSDGIKRVNESKTYQDGISREGGEQASNLKERGVEEKRNELESKGATTATKDDDDSDVEQRINEAVSAENLDDNDHHKRHSKGNDSKAGSDDPPIPKQDKGTEEIEEDDAELEQGAITLSQMLVFWKREIEPYDRVDRVFRLLKHPACEEGIRADDLGPMMGELLALHPGLRFLENTPEFQEKYARTVIARIIFQVNTSATGCITAKELRRSRLVDACYQVDAEQDINAVKAFFSYQHFYVLYCKFWLLDDDHDFVLTRDNVLKHGGHSLTSRVVDRVFQQAARPFSSNVPNCMGYDDFVAFLLAEEDKTSPTSIAYWFNCVDLDGDGVIEPWEMKYFFEEQMHRIQCLGHEMICFEDILCQLHDCVQPKHENRFRLKDFLNPQRMHLSGVFFNVLFNLNKFLAFEQQRDPFSARQAMEAGLTEWDRYAAVEYAQLTSGEGGQDDDDDDDDESDDDSSGFNQQQSNNNNNNNNLNSSNHITVEDEEDLDEQTTEEEDNNDDDDGNCDDLDTRGDNGSISQHIQSRNKGKGNANSAMSLLSDPNQHDGEESNSDEDESGNANHRDREAGLRKLSGGLMNLSHSLVNGSSKTNLDLDCADGMLDDDGGADGHGGLLDAFDARPEVEIRASGGRGGGGGGGGGWVDGSSVNSAVNSQGVNIVNELSQMNMGRTRSRGRSSGILSFDDMDVNDLCVYGDCATYESDSDQEEDSSDMLLCAGDVLNELRSPSERQGSDGGGAAPEGEHLGVLTHGGSPYGAVETHSRDWGGGQ